MIDFFVDIYVFGVVIPPTKVASTLIGDKYTTFSPNDQTFS